MKITINTNILDKYNLTFKEFLILLVGYYELGYEEEHNALMERGLVEKNLFSLLPPILSDNSKNLVSKILVESDDKAIKSNIDFTGLARLLQDIYPTGNKPGTSYPWRGDREEIAQKLRTLVVKYDFTFTMEEAIRATSEYVQSFSQATGAKMMHLLRNFILTTKRDGEGKYEIESIFMTIIENNREQHE